MKKIIIYTLLIIPFLTGQTLESVVNGKHRSGKIRQETNIVTQ